MKTVDIRNIYVCEILKQTETYEKQSQSTLDLLFFKENSYDWIYKKPTQSKFGLFTRTLGGYKHILTDTIYPKPSKRTVNKYVINPDNIEKLVKREEDICSSLINKHKSFYMNTDVIKTLEDRLNEKNYDLDFEIAEL